MTKEKGTAMNRLQQLSELGQSVWIDNLSRDLVKNGGLAAMMKDDAVVGVTSNPTIFQKAIGQGNDYDAQLKELAGKVDDPKELFLELSARDVADACDLLRPVYDATDGVDGYVSWEVDPTFAYDRDRTYDEAVRLHKWIDKPNLHVKIPATKPGLGAIEDMIHAGKNINVTLIFSLQRYAEVVEAYIRGLERLVAGSGDPAKVASVASFFVSRVDTECDRRLEEIGSKKALALRGMLAVANAKLAYQHYLEAFSGERWEFLAGKGARPQRCLWASTSAKNPAYRDVVYVEELIGADTVNTMPPETIVAFQDHGVAKPRLTKGLKKARAVYDLIGEVGVDIDDVTETLEAEGVSKFADSFVDLLAEVGGKNSALAA
jgi:transaldolase